MGSGKKERLRRIFDPADGRAVCVAADHGWMSDMTFNVVQLKRITKQVVEGGADAILMSFGQANRLGHLLQGRNTPALLVRADWMNMPRLGGANEIINAVPVQKLKRVAAGQAKDALELGASAITIYYFIGYSDQFEAQNVESLAVFARECSRIGLPCIIEPLAVGGMVTGLNMAKLLQSAARIAVEIGADALKIPYTNDLESFRELVRGCEVPVMMLGGARSFLERDALEIVEEGLNAGASGVVFGRNVTKAEDPADMVRKIKMLVHEGKSVDEIYLGTKGKMKLKVNSDKCTGCELCLLACHSKHFNTAGKDKAALRVEKGDVDKWEGENPLNSPVVCTLCGKCIDTCPVDAFSFDEETGALSLNRELCTECGACIKVCPVDVLKLNCDGLIYCDLCGGQPNCVKWCEKGAIEIVRSDS